MLFVGGDRLVRGASALASRIGVSPLAIGLTVVAAGTSAPALVDALQAAVQVSPAMSVGSNLFNILGILALTALAQPLAQGAITWADLWAMTALAALLTAFLATGRRLTRTEGAMLVVCYGAYTAYLVSASG